MTKHISPLRLEVKRTAAWHGQNPKYRYVAEITRAGVGLALEWGPTPKAAVAATRAKFLTEKRAA
jgi:hypothetical protein